MSSATRSQRSLANDFSCEGPKNEEASTVFPEPLSPKTAMCCSRTLGYLAMARTYLTSRSNPVLPELGQGISEMVG